MSGQAVALSKGKDTSTTKLIIGAVLALGLYFILSNTHFAGLADKGSQFLGLLAFVLVLWVFEVFPPGISGMLFMVLAVLLGLAKANVVFTGFTSSVTWLIFGALVIGGAADATGLAKRLAYAVIFKLKVDSPKKLLIAFILTGAVLTFIVPSMFGRVAVLTPLALGLIAATKAERDSKLARFIVLSMFVGAMGIKLSILTGMEPVLIAIQELSKIGINIYYSSYFAMWSIPSIILNPIFYYFGVSLVFKIKNLEFNKESLNAITEEYHNMEPMTRNEKLTLFWLVLAVLFWFTDFIHHIDPAWIAIFATVGLFAPKIRVMSVKEMQNKVNFLNIIFFASTLAIPALYGAVGIDKWLGQLMSQHLVISGQTLGNAFILSAIVQALHLLLSSIASTISTVTPLLITLSSQNGLDPVWVIFILFANVSVYLFPYQSGPLVMTYSLGYLRMSDILKFGAFLSIGTMIVTPLLAVLWWSWIIPLMVH